MGSTAAAVQPNGLWNSQITIYNTFHNLTPQTVHIVHVVCATTTVRCVRDRYKRLMAEFSLEDWKRRESEYIRYVRISLSNVTSYSLSFDVWCIARDLSRTIG